MDGGRGLGSPYTDKNEGTDQLGNAYSNGDPSTGNLVGGDKDPKTGDPVYQKDFPDAFVSTTSKAKNPNKGNSDPDRYYDPEKDNFIATNPDLTKGGIRLNDNVEITYHDPSGKSIKVQATVADTGPSHYKVKGKDGKWHGGYVKGSIEGSPHLFRNFMPIEKKIPKGINRRTGKPFQTAKYGPSPNMNLEVRKIIP